jgi:predicted GNAT family acetyltransferase
MTSAIETAVRRILPADLPAVRELVDRNPVANVLVASRLDHATARGPLDTFRLGGDLIAYAPGGRLQSLCFVGGNLVPVAVTEEAVEAFASRLARRVRLAASLVGDADAVLALWDRLEPSWGPAREVRPCQPLLAIDRPPQVPVDPNVRPVQLDEVDTLFPASVAMFTEEVGVSPVADGGANYRARVRELVAGGYAFARFDHRPSGPAVTFKADVGYATAAACQVQGVWVEPTLRGRGHGVAGMAAVVELARRTIAPVVSLYVNDFNQTARAVYERVGFEQVGTFATVLL